uniref:Replication factor A C-terminal domain-containing protein n=1 Tax=Ananas comosus var. bracteatus TaxID=296719 RepID=A0A6V7QKT7_ANACO|nr:unnamed protein product [Ananas comosus var. bracteatus]
MDFRNNLCRRQTPIAPIQHIKSLNEPILSPYEQISRNRKTIDKLLKLNPDELENSKYTCKGKLATVDTTYGWWYKAVMIAKEQYKLNAIVEDETGSANFTIFGKLAQDLIHAPAHHLATAINSDRNVLPTAIKNILGQTYIFQVLADSRKHNIGVPSFRVAKIFAPDLDTKGKGKQVSTNTEITGEVTDTTAIATESHYGLNEVSPYLTVESLITQPSSEMLQLNKKKGLLVTLKILHPTENEAYY